MCGIVAIIHADTTSDSAAADLHDALYLLQHRGQDACGITTCGSGGRIYQCKGNGLASKVFNDGERVTELHGFMGLGHLRYPTMGSASGSEAQPLFVNSPYGICISRSSFPPVADSLACGLDTLLIWLGLTPKLMQTMAIS